MIRFPIVRLGGPMSNIVLQAPRTASATWKLSSSSLWIILHCLFPLFLGGQIAIPQQTFKPPFIQHSPSSTRAFSDVILLTDFPHYRPRQAHYPALLGPVHPVLLANHCTPASGPGPEDSPGRLSSGLLPGPRAWASSWLPPAWSRGHINLRVYRERGKDARLV